MEQPERFIVKSQDHKVCKLVKSLYGLKQAPKQTHENSIVPWLKMDSLSMSVISVYTITVEDACIIFCLYVDDMLILETILKLLSSLKEYYPTILTWRIWGLLM